MAKLAKNEKQLRKNDVLFKAGTPAGRLYVVGQGLISVSMPGGEEGSLKNIELYKAGQNQIVGEEVLRHEATYSTNGIALNDAVVLEIPAETVRVLLGCAVPMVKFLANGMVRRQSQISAELKAIKMQEIPGLPCPPEKIAKLFAVLYRVATYTGKKKGDLYSVEWTAFRRYCQRVFWESPVRVEQAIWLLVSLHFAQVQMIPDETDPEAPEVIGYIHFRNLEALSGFAEFYRKNFDPKDPQAVLFAPGSQSDSVLAILHEIDHWNKSGLPKGMPKPPEVNPKYLSKRKAG